MITAEKVRELFDYDPKTGAFTWRVLGGSPFRPQPIGSPAGTFDKQGYRVIRLKDFGQFKVHRLIWLYVYGELPTRDVDHANGDPGDNSLANLRLATRSQNNANSRKPRHNTTGVKGVIWDRARKLWRAEIKRDGVRRYLGRFGSVAEAHAAYHRAAAMTDGEFHRHD